MTRSSCRNGQFQPGKWDDGVEIKTPAELTFHLKIDGTYLYLGIRFLGPRHTGIDLYLAEPGAMRKKLHRWLPFHADRLIHDRWERSVEI